MQQYQVPQFINIEDRIIGPLTLKQFLYLLGAGALGLVGWNLLYLPLFIILVLPLALLLVALAFGKVDERPFPAIFMSAVNYYLKPRLYLWKKAIEKKKAPVAKAPARAPSPLDALTHLSGEKLNDLAWSLDVKERIERGDESLGNRD